MVQKGATNLFCLVVKAVTPIGCSFLIWEMQHHACEHGIDGTALMTAIVLIAGLGGYSVREMFNILFRHGKGE